MAAQSATGTGKGSAGKLTTKELSILANAPSILAAGRVEVEAEDGLSSPPSTINLITLENPLPGSHTNYVVILTGLNTGATYVGAMYNDGNGNFNRFLIFSEGEGTCMYLVTKVGIKPNV